jgi:predicted kinase
MKPLSLSRPHLIVMVGIPGSGKTYFAEHFASTFRVPIVNQNKIQNEIFGSLNGGEQEDAISEQAAAIMLQEMVKTNQSVIYEGPTGSRVRRTEVARFARSVGYVPLFIWVQTDSAEASRRAMNSRKADGYLTDEQFDYAVRHFSVPAEQEKAIVISGKHTYASQLKIVLKYLSNFREGVQARSTPRRPTPPERPSTTPPSIERSSPRRTYIR